MALGQIVIAETPIRKAGELTVEWIVGDFFNLSTHWKDKYESHVFGFGDGCWLLELHPNVYTRDPGSDRMMSLFLTRKDSGPAMTVLFTFGIKAVDGVMKRRGAQREFSYCSSFGFHEIWSRVELKDHEARMMPDKVLTITCDLKVEPGAGGGSFQDASVQTEGEFREVNGDTGESQSLDKQDAAIETYESYNEVTDMTEGNQLSEKQGIGKVVEDVGKLLVSRAISDITVRVGDVQFQVDRDVLLARSSTTLQLDRAEGTLDRTPVYDCAPDVFEDFVHYIYAESVQSLTEQNVFALYRIADKCLLGDLKLRCLVHMRDTLSVRTFCDTVRLALSHGEGDLLERAFDFGRENVQSIICSEEWQNFNREHPTEANEVLVKCICPQT